MCQVLLWHLRHIWQPRLSPKLTFSIGERPEEINSVAGDAKCYEEERGGWRKRGKRECYFRQCGLEMLSKQGDPEAVSHQGQWREGEPPQQKEENTRRLEGGREAWSQEGGTAAGPTQVREPWPHKSLPMSQPQMHSSPARPPPPHHLPVLPVQSPLQVSRSRIILHLSFGPTLSGILHSILHPNSVTSVLLCTWAVLLIRISFR